MLYFVGLGGPEVSLEELLEKMPHSDNDITRDLERLEQEGYIRASADGIYPVETEGFNNILQDTEYDQIDDTAYSLDEKGQRYVRQAEIQKIEESLRQVMK